MKSIPKKAHEFPDLHEATGYAVAGFCREKYPRHTAKRVARDVDCEPATAKRWLQGHLPGSKHLLTMIQRWGPEFLVILLEPIDETMARNVRLDNDIKKLSQELHRIQEEMRDKPEG